MQWRWGFCHQLAIVVASPLVPGVTEDQQQAMAHATISVMGPASAGLGSQRANEMELLLMRAEVGGG